MEDFTIKARAFLIALAIAASAYSAQAHAFCITLTPYFGYRASALEAYDAPTDRFYVAVSEDTSSGCFSRATEPIESFGVVTGLGWSTWWRQSDSCNQPSALCSAFKPLCRFRAVGQREPASQFFSLNSDECQALSTPGSGWIAESAFNSATQTGALRLGAFAIDPATGQCPSGTVPVRRFFNNRSQEGLANHRFVADVATRTMMRSRPGWT